MKLLLHRYRKRGCKAYPWLIDEECIETVNGTQYGTYVVTNNSTDDTYVTETVEEIADMIGAKRAQSEPEEAE